MLTGKVKSYNEQRGFGFITTPADGDIFVYYTAIVGEGFKKLVPDSPEQHIV